MTKILCVVGARPNFIKIGPVMSALAGAGFECCLVHTGQHYDAAMNDAFFKDLRLPHPDFNLEVGSGNHAEQTAEIMRRFDPVLASSGAAAVLVVGDVNSTIACALVAAKRGIKVIHVEAGLRSYDRTMPEEINRVLTDQISDVLFTTERLAEANLAREGIAPERIFFIGNVMIDTLHRNRDRFVSSTRQLNGRHVPNGYALATLHRPSNVDDPAVLRRVMECMRTITQTLPIVFPIHPRTRARIEALGLGDLLSDSGIMALPPVGYLEMLGLVADARVVLTDSGGLQEETTALGVPCLTLRENTERPITVEQGTNTLVGTDPAVILAAYRDVLESGGKKGCVPEYWDGRASERVAAVLVDRLAQGGH